MTNRIVNGIEFYRLHPWAIAITFVAGYSLGILVGASL